MNGEVHIFKKFINELRVAVKHTSVLCQEFLMIIYLQNAIPEL